MAGVLLLCLCIGSVSGNGFLSPRIVFDTNRDGSYEIYVMNADGTGQTRLTNDPGWDWEATWSPDLSKIAFTSDRGAISPEIWVMNADGSGQTQLTNNGADDGYPSWSPDGTRIAFNSYRTGNNEIWVMNADGGGQTQLTNDATSNFHPVWSPDGTKIAYVNFWDIYVMNADGSDQTQLTTDPAVDWTPAWSPDGTKIAFRSERDGNPEIYVMNADGTGQTRLTNDPMIDDHPSFSMDGTQIVFHSQRIGPSWQIYVMNVDGSGVTRLTNNGATDGEPSWSPNVVAGFSATNINGPALLMVPFTDSSLNNPKGWAWFFGDESYNGIWSSSTAPWSERGGHSTVVLPDGSIVLTGGVGSGGNDFNDVYRSTNGGSTWTLMTASAPWHARNHHTTVALPDGSILLMGGGYNAYPGITRVNDIWRSTDNGATWTQLPDAPWSARQELTSVVLPDGSIEVIGGVDNSPSPSWAKDVWRSTDGGVSWSQITANAEWPARFAFSSNVLPDGSIVVIGGHGGDPSNYHYLNDVWRSTDNGATWQIMTGNGTWQPRNRHSTVVMPDGTIVLMGGYYSDSGGTWMTDVWLSKDNGATWKEANIDAWAGTGREASESVVLPDGRIVAMGGIAEANFLNDVWVISPAGSSTQNPSHQYTTPGSYTVALQAYNPGGYSSTRKTGFVNVINPDLFPAVQSAVQTVVHTKLNDDTTGKSVSAYQTPLGPRPTVNLWGTKSVTFSDPDLNSCTLVAVDNAPEANWEHSVSYYCVDGNNRVEQQDSTAPVDGYTLTYATGMKTTPGEVWQPNDPYVWSPGCVNDCSNNYALLIDGGKDANSNAVRYWNDIAFMYINLKDYGYDTTKKVTVMMSDGSSNTVVDRCIAGSPTCTQTQNSPSDLDGDGTPEVYSDAGRTTILNKLESWKPGLSTSLPAGANLLIFTTGHGGVANGRHYFYAWGGTGAGQYITDSDLMLKLNQLTQLNSITLIMENCNSGGFAPEFLAGSQKRRILYAAAADEPSWGNGFSNALTTAYAGHTRYYTRDCTAKICSADYDKSADTSHDERILASEAIGYVALKDPYFTSSQTPVAGKERSGMQANSAAAADGTTQFMSSCSGTPPTSTITVTSPTGGLKWQLGTKHLISWNAVGLANRNVKITLYNGTVPKYVIVGAPGVSATNPPWFDWTIPLDPIKTYTTNVYKIKIEPVDTSSVSGMSAAFQINAKPSTNSGKLQINVTEKDASPTKYLNPDYTVSDPSTGLSAATGTIAAAFAGTTTGTISPLGDYYIALTKEGYYPVSNAPVTVATGTKKVSLTMVKLPADPNADTPPYGGIDVSSSPAGASIWVSNKDGSTLTDSGWETNTLLYLVPGTYEVQVKKAGYMDSDVRTLTVESMTPTRLPEKIEFVLEPLVTEYTVEGFFAPVDMNGMVNNAKAGQTVAAKWHLVDETGPVSDPASFMGLYSYEIACETLAGSPSDTLPPENDAGSSGLQYLGDGNWQYNWKTLKSYTRNGGCREMFVRFNDGQELHAFFKFK